MLFSCIIIDVGRKKPHWGEDDHKPNWWSSSLQFADPSNGPARPNVGSLSRIIRSYIAMSDDDSDSDDYQSLPNDNSDPDTTDLDPPPSVVLDNAPSTSNSAAEASDDILATFASLVVRFYTACNVLSSVESTLTRIFLSLYTVPYRSRE